MNFRLKGLKGYFLVPSIRRGLSYCLKLQDRRWK